MRELDREDAVAARAAPSRPATKSLRSGTCASTLLPTSRSAVPLRGAQARAALAPKNSTTVGTPARLGDRATLAAGSMPSTGMPRCDEVLEEIAVVARDLDDLRVGPSPKRSIDLRRRSAARAPPSSPSTTRSTRSRRRSPPAAADRAAARAGTRRRRARAADRSARRGELILAQVEFASGETPRSTKTCASGAPQSLQASCRLATGADRSRAGVLHSSLSAGGRPHAAPRAREAG